MRSARLPRLRGGVCDLGIDYRVYDDSQSGPTAVGPYSGSGPNVFRWSINKPRSPRSPSRALRARPSRAHRMHPSRAQRMHPSRAQRTHQAVLSHAAKPYSTYAPSRAQRTHQAVLSHAAKPYSTYAPSRSTRTFGRQVYNISITYLAAALVN